MHKKKLLSLSIAAKMPHAFGEATKIGAQAGEFVLGMEKKKAADPFSNGEGWKGKGKQGKAILK
ncbi:hypothetical protein [Neptuniibacter sp. QD37_11]|uniref:hypothetical protein n=1 Tax=Neptuniibacter sp. QD37_11 TaxID=3398209 RepID=UPI0039F47644